MFLYYVDKKERFPIKTKINYPFIYFLLEADTVTVYHITSSAYITTEDLTSYTDWETYDLMNGQEIDTFLHTEHRPRESYGFIISQQQLHTMVEQINSAIQQNLTISSSSKVETLKSNGEIHLIASESAAGSIRSSLKGPKCVIPVPGFLSIGPLWRLTEHEGIVNRNEWLSDHINFEMEDGIYEQRFANSLREIEDIPEDTTLFIWHGPNADEQTTLRFLLHFLKDKENDIVLIDTEDQGCFHSDPLDLERMRTLYTANRSPIGTAERLQLQQEWEVLSQSKELLRIWKDGKVKGVAEDYYDLLILETVQKLQFGQKTPDFIPTGHVIGEILSEKEPTIDIHFLEYRVRHLVYTGKLAMKGIPKSMRHYRVKLL